MIPSQKSRKENPLAKEKRKRRNPSLLVSNQFLSARERKLKLGKSFRLKFQISDF